MTRHAVRAVLIGLAALTAGTTGCGHQEAAKPPAVTQNNPLGMPAAELNKVNHMGPQQRLLVGRQLSQMQQRKAAGGTANAPNSGQ